MVEAERGWRDAAACRTTDPDTFFPVAERGPELARQVAAAKAVCAGCAVIELCRAWAVEALPVGVAGGLTAAERRAQRATARSGGAGSVADGAGRVEPPVGGNRREFAAAGRRAVASGESVASVARRFGVDERTAYLWRAAVTGAAAASGGAR